MPDEQKNGQQGGTALETPVPSYRFFTNPACEFFPCHKADEADFFNCLFCYCPLYAGECPGEHKVRIINGHEVKDCSECRFPHLAENYDDMIRCLMERIS
jgi:Zn-finger protein